MATSAAIANPRLTNGANSCHWLSCPRIAPNPRPPTPTAMITAPIQSNRPSDASSRDSGEGGPQRDGQQGNVDDKRRSPREEVHQSASDERTQDGCHRSRTSPDAKRLALLLLIEGRGDDRQRYRHDEGAGCPLKDPECDQCFHRNRKSAQHRRHSKAAEADEEPAPATVEVTHGTGKDEQGRQREQVPVVDIRLRFEHSQVRRSQFVTDLGEGHRDDRGIQKHDPGSENRSGQSPPLPVRHSGSSPRIRLAECAGIRVLRRPRGSEGERSSVAVRSAPSAPAGSRKTYLGPPRRSSSAY